MHFYMTHAKKRNGLKLFIAIKIIEVVAYPLSFCPWVSLSQKSSQNS